MLSVIILSQKTLAYNILFVPKIILFTVSNGYQKGVDVSMTFDPFSKQHIFILR